MLHSEERTLLLNKLAQVTDAVRQLTVGQLMMLGEQESFESCMHNTYNIEIDAYI